MSGPLEDLARSRGPISPGHYRVLVIEHDDAVTHHDFDSLDRARTYATDVASEIDELAKSCGIYDDALNFLEHGRHYAATKK